MDLEKDLANLVANLKTERDEIQLKLHLASMEVKDEFKKVEKRWEEVSQKASDIANDSVETSAELVGKAKIIGEEVQQAYQKIKTRLSE